MSRILNSGWPRDENERWKMYKEADYGDIYDLSKKREDKKMYATKTKMQKTMLHQMSSLITR